MLQWIKNHSLILLLAAGAVFTFDWLVMNKKRLKVRWYAALALAVISVITGVACVKLFALAEAGFNIEKAGSLSLFGAVFLLPVFYFIGSKLFKKKPADVFDVFTVPMVFTIMCARINCLISGCCLGRFICDTGSRWPTREAELVFYVIFLAVMIPMVFKGKGRGKALPLYMIAYGAFRFVIEFFRESTMTFGIFHLSHIWAILSVAAGALAFAVIKSKHSSSAPVKRG